MTHSKGKYCFVKFTFQCCLYTLLGRDVKHGSYPRVQTKRSGKRYSNLLPLPLSYLQDPQSPSLAPRLPFYLNSLGLFALSEKQR